MAKQAFDNSDGSDECASGETIQCQMVEIGSDSYDTKSELEWDSEGDLPIKNAHCAECKKERDYWIMFECHRCVQVFHSPCIAPDGKEAVVMDDRYDSYVCPSCEALYAYESSKREVRTCQGEGSSTQYEKEFATIVSCHTCEQQGNS